MKAMDASVELRNRQLVEFVFDQMNNEWNEFNYQSGQFERLDSIPKLTENFAGIGTREINENGKNAIKRIFETNIKLGYRLAV